MAEPGALIGFAGARVIEQTVRETLPEGFQRAEYLLDHGIVDMVVQRRKLRDTLIRVIQLIRNPRPAGGAASIVPAGLLRLVHLRPLNLNPPPTSRGGTGSEK